LALDTKDGAGSNLGVHRTSLATNIVCGCAAVVGYDLAA